MTSSAPIIPRPPWYRRRWVTAPLKVVAKALVTLLITLLGAVAAIAIAPLTPWFDRALSQWKYIDPTCADPQGLKMLELREKGVATVKVSTGEAEPVGERPEYDGQTAMHSFDGRPGSGWVPTTFSPEGNDFDVHALVSFDDSITLDFANPQQIALVCVVNGNSASWISYMRADRVRTVEVSLSLGDGEKLTRRTSLRTLPEYEIQTRQELELPNSAPVWKKNEPSYDQLKLTLPERWMGIAVEDPNTLPDLDLPTHQVMLAEVEVWVHTEQ